MKNLLILGFVLLLHNCHKSTENRRSSHLNHSQSSEAIAAEEKSVSTPTPIPTTSPAPTIKPTQLTLVPIKHVGFGVKLLSANQINNQIKNCFGRELMTVRAESIISPITNSNEQGSNSNAFLLPLEFFEGTNIVELLKFRLDGPSKALAVSTRTLAPSLSYLSAIKTIGNVVGHNCELSSLEAQPYASRCACNTPTEARRIFNQCTPWISIDQDESIATEFAALCNENHKSAIASYISSFVFSFSP